MISESNEHPDCYRFEHLEDSSVGFLDKGVDATYVLHLVGNGRLEKVYAQLEKFKPTQTIYLLHNQGYKKCTKDPEIDKPPLDVVDAFLEIFRHAHERGYRNILILEDDFQFNEIILQPTCIDDITEFTLQHRSEDFCYLLGCLPVMNVPIDFEFKHYWTPLCFGMHAAIYSQSCRDRVLQTNPAIIQDWDIFHNFHSTQYTYSTPLCYQLFPETENQKTWADGYWYLHLFVPIGIQVLKWFKMDTQAEPGYSFFYAMSKWMFWILILGAVGLLYGGVRFFSSLFPSLFPSLFSTTIIHEKKGGKKGKF